MKSIPMLNNRYVLALEVINGSNLVVPSHRVPTGLYVLVSTSYGQWNTAVKTVMADRSVPWNETLLVYGLPLMLPQWLMPIFPNTLKAVHLEIRATFENEMLGRGELVGTVETTLEELLMHDEQFEMSFPVVNTRYPSLLLKARRINTLQLAGHSSTIQCSRFQRKSNRLTDAAHEAYALYRKSNNRNNLDSAIQGFQAVIDRCPVGHPSRAAALSNLAYVILHAFTKDIPVDIERAISLFRSALALRPTGHPDHPISILNLCKALHQRNSHRRDRADLREVAKLYHSLLPLCVEGSYLQLHVIEECNALARDPSDESIMLRRTVLGYCQPRHEYRARSLNRLAGDLYARFQWNGDLSHIYEAVDLSREALVECPADSEHSFFLSVLAYTLKLRFHHLRNPSDISECISLNREALSLRPSGHPARQISLNNLAKALEASYVCYGSITEFQEAIHLDEAAYDLSSEYLGTPQNQHGEEYDYLGMGQLTCTPEAEEGEDQPAKSPLSDHQTRPRARNIVIFGESGSGKSSVINALAQNQLAATSSSAAGCTFRYGKHEVELSGQSFILFDTVGLDEGTAGTVPAAEAEANLKSLLRELMSPGLDGISLLVYCVRSVRVSRALLRNYNLFYSAICRKKVPIVVVVTGLENQDPIMDSWWDTNGGEFKRCGMHFEDHACVTTLRKHPDIPDVFTQRITESRENLRTLVLNNCSKWTADASWLAHSFADVRNMISGRRNNEKSSPPTLIIYDWSQKEVKIAHGIHGVVETCSARIGRVKYQVHHVFEPVQTPQTSCIAADLLIFYAHADEQSAARQRFDTYCAAYRGNMVPIIVVVKGLNAIKAAQEWVEQYLTQNGAGRPFVTFAPADDLRDRNAEQELQELIQQSCLIRSEGKSGGIYTTLVNFLGG